MFAFLNIEHSAPPATGPGQTVQKPFRGKGFGLRGSRGGRFGAFWPGLCSHSAEHSSVASTLSRCTPLLVRQLHNRTVDSSTTALAASGAP